MYASAELRQKYLLALLTRDAAIWHARMEVHALWTGPDDDIERHRKTAQRRKLIRLRDERIRAGLKVKRYSLPTGRWSSAERADAFTSGCIVCGRPFDHARLRSGTCSLKCYHILRNAARPSRSKQQRAS